jgi:hypothetical protein
MQLLYHPGLDKYLAIRGDAGAPISVINPDTWEVTRLSVTGNGSLPSAELVDTNAYVFTRALYVPRLSGIVHGPAFAQNLWFLRTH